MRWKRNVVVIIKAKELVQVKEELLRHDKSRGERDAQRWEHEAKEAASRYNSKECLEDRKQEVREWIELRYVETTMKHDSEYKNKYASNIQTALSKGYLSHMQQRYRNP